MNSNVLFKEYMGLSRWVLLAGFTLFMLSGQVYGQMMLQHAGHGAHKCEFGNNGVTFHVSSYPLPDREGKAMAPNSQCTHLVGAGKYLLSIDLYDEVTRTQAVALDLFHLHGGAHHTSEEGSQKSDSRMKILGVSAKKYPGGVITQEIAVESANMYEIVLTTQSETGESAKYTIPLHVGTGKRGPLELTLRWLFPIIIALGMVALWYRRSASHRG